MNPLAQHPSFALAFKIEKVALRDLNPFLEWQWDLKVKKGIFALYAAADAADGGFQGYVKPFFEGLEVDTPPDKKGPVQTIKKAAVNAVSRLLKNKRSEQIATKIPFQGRFENPTVGLWEAVSNVLRNAFIAALQPRLEKGTHLS